MSQLDVGCSTSMANNENQRSLPVSRAPSGLGSGITWKEAEVEQQTFSTTKDYCHGSHPNDSSVPASTAQPFKTGKYVVLWSALTKSIHQQRFKGVKTEKLPRRGVYVPGSAKKKTRGEKECVAVA